MTDPVITKEDLAVLDEPFRSALLSMYAGAPQTGLDGRAHSIAEATKISTVEGLWLYDLCLREKPRTTLEIGMAYGFSTLYILAAAAKNGAGHHTAIDPLQRTVWNGIGLAHAEKLAPRLNGTDGFRFMEDRSDRAATDLAREERTFDLVFIDGNHRFDDVLVDFYLYAQLCSIGGLIVFDDMWMNSIKTVAEFVRTNRVDFAEVPASAPNVRVFRKTSKDNRKWYEFQEFKVSPSSMEAPG